MLANYLCEECLLSCSSGDTNSCQCRAVTVICFDNACFKASIEVLPGVKSTQGDRIAIPDSWKQNRSILAVFDGVCQAYSPWLSEPGATVVYMDQVRQEVGCALLETVKLAPCGQKPDFSTPEWERKSVICVLSGACTLLNRFGERLKPVDNAEQLTG